uniref:Uncharacterized protein n=1 Tax=Arundo donax TaxID=35708 RepID=A0A0A9C036_ARUDO
MSRGSSGSTVVFW